MKNITLLISIFILTISHTAFSAPHRFKNDSSVNIIERFDKISYQWDILAKELVQYSGLSNYCLETSYKNNVLILLEEIHHIDSLVYQELQALAIDQNNHEIRKTIKQVEELESAYGLREFADFLSAECQERKKIEKSRNDLKANLGQESYDGQQQLIESIMNRYINHVTYLVDHIRKHLHELKI